MYIKRFFSSIRQYIDTDVLIVGGGPAGLSAAIHLKQLNKSINVVLLEKGPEIGSHIVSGVVFDPISLDELLPDWRSDPNIPLKTKVSHDKFRLLVSDKSSIPLPIPKLIRNTDSYYIGSLSQLTRWMGEKALELGVEIYTGFSGSKPIFDQKEGDKTIGVYTNDFGILKDGTHSKNYEMGVGLRAKHVLLAEGAHGSLSKMIIEKYKLRSHVQHQTFGLGLKEVWQVKKENHQKGLVMHTLGWPLDSSTYGGSFMYHWDEDLVSIGLVIGLDYKNPYLNPYQEFQRLKLHPQFSKILKGGTCMSYGARVINEGGWQSIPKLSFPGGALIGCSGGFLNVPRIKGSHLAIKSGMIAAQAIHNQNSLEDYDRLVREESWIGKELWKVRNVRPAFHKFGLYGGLLYSGMELILSKGAVPWTLKHGPPDYQCLEPASKHKEISYPKPDGELTFPLLDNVYKTGTFHREDQPSHLQLKTLNRQERESWPIYRGVESKFCPAGVYEYHIKSESSDSQQKDSSSLPVDGQSVKFHINAQNCIHCKTCDIKDPLQNINWAVPEGGGGPKYTNL